MANHHMTDQGPVAFTAQEESDRALAETAYAAGAGKRAAQALIDAIEASVTKRRTREAILGLDAGWLAARQAEIVVLRASL